jgi:hypothetical protein
MQFQGVNPTNPLLFYLLFNSDDKKIHDLDFIVDSNYIKLSRNHFRVTETETLYLCFDPKSTQSTKREIEVSIIDTITKESIILKIILSKNYNIISTDFDISKDGYNFPNKEDICYGMAKTSVSYFNYRHDPQFSPNKEPPRKKLTYLLTQDEAMPDIDSYYDPINLAKNPLTNIFKSIEKKFSGDKSYYNKEYDVLVRELSSGRPIPLTFKPENGQWHWVVAYGLVEYDAFGYIIIYDNGYPLSKSFWDAFPVVIYDKKNSVFMLDNGIVCSKLDLLGVVQP